MASCRSHYHTKAARVIPKASGQCKTLGHIHATKAGWGLLLSGPTGQDGTGKAPGAAAAPLTPGNVTRREGSPRKPAGFLPGLKKGCLHGFQKWTESPWREEKVCPLPRLWFAEQALIRSEGLQAGSLGLGGCSVQPPPPQLWPPPGRAAPPQQPAGRFQWLCQNGDVGRVPGRDGTNSIAETQE